MTPDFMLMADKLHVESTKKNSGPFKCCVCVCARRACVRAMRASVCVCIAYFWSASVCFTGPAKVASTLSNSLSVSLSRLSRNISLLSLS